MIGPIVGAILVLAVGLPQSLHVAVLSLLWLIFVREFQDYVVNPRIAVRRSGCRRSSRSVSVAVVGVLFGGFAVILAVPFTSAVATLDRRPRARSRTPHRTTSALAPAAPPRMMRSRPHAVDPSRRPVLFVNPKSGGGKAARAGLAEQARERGIEVIVVPPDDARSAGR